MENKVLKPKIRFKGFTDTWEQRKLGKIANIIGGGTPSTLVSKYWNGDINWYSPVEIGDKIFVSSSQKKITQLGYEKSSAKLLPIGTVLFTSRAGIGNTAILAKEGCTNQGFQSIVPNKKEIDSYFIYSMTNQLKEYGEKIGAGSTFAEVSGKQMEEMPINIPKLEEQCKISQLFEKIDNLITLHQSKYDKLVNVKKALLEKMFPKDGKNVPEIRFKGFTDTWEQRKLKDESDYIVAGGDIEKNKIDENGKYPVIANALTNEGIVGYYKEDYRIKAPAVTVTGRGDVGHAVARNIDFTPVVRLLTIKSKHYNYFLENAINNLNVVVESTGVPQLTVPQLENYEIQFPKDLNEETQIGNLFKQIDNLITLHQHKLEKLKNMKKSLLNKMFI